MAQFKFNTVSRTDIEGSLGGSQMLAAIDYDGPDHLLITGCPGSGKTTINIMRAERLINLNKNILVLTYQDLLKNSLKNIATNELKPNIYKFYKWYSGRFGFLEDTKTEIEMKNSMISWEGVDEIIVDEGQDFEARIFRSLISKTKKITVGADNAQKVHFKGLKSSEIHNEIQNHSNVFQISLQYNYRNTYEIYNFARHFLPHNQRVNNLLAIDKIPRGSGEIPTVFLVPDRDTQIAQLNILLENAGDRNVAVLLYHVDDVQKYFDIINELGFTCSMHHSGEHVDLHIENILITTYKSAKGLEFEVVIMPDMDRAMSRHYMTPEHYYVSGTRAKENLYLITEGLEIPNYFKDFEENSYTLNKTPIMIKPIKNKINLDHDADIPF